MTAVRAAANKKKQRHASWQPDFPYKAEYNDHFETPFRAYQDIQPIIDLILQSESNTNNSTILYDPYYCNGQTKKHLQNLGYTNIVHEKRDFYKDIRLGRVPDYAVLITNPPYSDQHKIKCLEFCFSQTQKSKPFLILLPAYVAARTYYTKLLLNAAEPLLYILPNVPYHYTHPQGTGHDTSPFVSCWFCGNLSQQVRDTILGNTDWKSTTIRVLTLAQLHELDIISIKKRPNPKQRQKRKAANSIEKQWVPEK
jgi:hypothetical protein